MDLSQLKPQTLAQVSDALEAVEVARAKRGLSASDKSALQDIALNLRSMERSMEKTIQDGLVASLNKDTAGLTELMEKIKKASKKLDKLAGILETTAKVVDAFAKIVTTAVGAGLL